MLIVDASVAVKWVVDEPNSDSALALLGEPLAAPALWLAEAANALWRKCLRGEISPGNAEEGCRLLGEVPIVTLGLDLLLPLAMSMALDLRHPIYDCFYLAAAKLHNSTLVTADVRLVQRVAAHPECSARIRTLGHPA
jgi:predicted nucleic acid-binding protein